MDIFSFPEALRPTAEKVIFDAQPVAYSYGNREALTKWLKNMDGRKINQQLGMSNSRKYPLVWLNEGWTGNKKVPGYRFTNCEFYISVNSTIEQTNENRKPQFEKCYKVANDFIQQLKLSGFRIVQDSIDWGERANFGEGNLTKGTDVWDTVILSMEIDANTNCFKHIKT